MLSPVLHNKVPAAVVDNIEVPQLFATLTAGIEGVGFMVTATALEAAEEQPPIVTSVA